MPRIRGAQRHTGTTIRDRLPLASLIVFVSVYLFWYFSRTLPAMSLWLQTPQAPSRWLVFWTYVWPDILLDLWSGGEGHWRASLTDRWPVILAAVTQIAVAWSVGWLCLSRPLRHCQVSAMARDAISVAAGLHLMSLWTLLVGLMGRLDQPIWFWLPGCVLLVLGTANRCRRAVPSPIRVAGPWLTTLPFVFLLGAVAILPPTDFDVREYHLQVPKEWHLAGRIDFLPHNVYGNMPLGAEMSALTAMSWTWWRGDDRWWYGALVGKLIMASYVLLAAWILPWSLGPAQASPRGNAAGHWSPVLLLSTPWVLHIAAAGLNENALGLYLMLAAWFAWRDAGSWDGPDGSEHHAARALVWQAGLSGFFGGAALSVKYTALLFGLPLPLLLAVRHFRSPQLGRALLAFSVAATLSGGGWYVKNLYLAHNPIYPLQYKWLDGASRNVAKDAQWRRAHRVPVDQRGRSYTLTQLRDALRLFAGASQWQHGLLIPMALLGLCAIARDPARSGWESVVMLGWCWGSWWLVTHRLDRFWVPILPWLVQLAAYGIAWPRGLYWRRFVIFAFSLTLPMHWVLAASPCLGADWRWLVPLAALRSDPARVTAVHRYLNQHMPRDKYVLLVGDAQPFDLEVPTYYNTCFDSCLFEDWLGNRAPQAQRQVLHDRRVMYVYYDRGEVQRYQSPGNYGYTPFVSDQRFAKLVREGVLEPQQMGEWASEMSNHDGVLYRVREP